MAISIKAGKILINNKYTASGGAPLGGYIMKDHCSCCCRCNAWNRKTGSYDTYPKTPRDYQVKPLTGVITSTGYRDVNFVWEGSHKFPSWFGPFYPVDLNGTDMELFKVEVSSQGVSSMNTTKIYDLRQVRLSGLGLPWSCSSSELTYEYGQIKRTLKIFIRWIPYNRVYEYRGCAVYSVFLHLSQNNDLVTYYLGTPVSLSTVSPCATSEIGWFINGNPFTAADLPFPFYDAKLVAGLRLTSNPGSPRNSLVMPGNDILPFQQAQCKEWTKSFVISAYFDIEFHVTDLVLATTRRFPIWRERTEMIPRWNWRLYYPSPASGSTLETEGGVTRVTESGDVRIIE